MRNISIIAPVFNAVDMSIRCLQAIWATAEEPDKIHVYIVDNGSTDGTPEKLKQAMAQNPYQHRERTQIIELIKNTGFSHAVNRGMEAAPIGDGFVILNNDVILDRGWQSGIERTMTDHAGQKIGVVGAKLRFPAGNIQHAGAELTVRGDGRHLGGTFDHGEYDQYLEMEYVAFAFVFIPWEAFQDIGYLDEKFHLYYEDCDYAYKARAAGYKVIYSPHLAGIHFHNWTGRTLPAQQNRGYERESKQRFLRKWGV